MSELEDAGTVKSERDGGVALLTLSNPKKRNALTAQVKTALLAALEAALADPDCRAIVLTGEGASFCAGGDVASFGGVSAVGGRRRMQQVAAIVRALAGEKPVIAAVEGHAAGAGLSLASACDFVVAARDAQFSCPYNRLGLFPDYGLAWSLPLRMGIGRAKLLMIGAVTLDGEAAGREGLVEIVTEPGQALEAALTLARRIAGTAPITNGLVKAVLARGPASLEEVLAREAEAQGIAFGSEDMREGLAAFNEKRPPRFRGR